MISSQGLRRWRKPKMSNHAHHIVQKTISKAFPIMGKYIARSQAIMDKVGIDVLKGTENLTWALKWDHSVEYAKAVAETLEKAYTNGFRLGGAAVRRRPWKRRWRRLRRYLIRARSFVVCLRVR